MLILAKPLILAGLIFYSLPDRICILALGDMQGWLTCEIKEVKGA